LESVASVEWSFAWPGCGIELDSSCLDVDFIGGSFALAVFPPLVPSVAEGVTDGAGGEATTLAVGASCECGGARSHPAIAAPNTSTVPSTDGNAWKRRQFLIESCPILYPSR
jgi:hypothetical protein